MGSILLWASGRGDFSIGLLTPFPKNSFGWECKARSSLCTHAFHCTDSNKRSWHSYPRWVNAGNKNTPIMHYPWRWNMTTYMVGLENIYAKISLQNDEAQRCSWECRTNKGTNYIALRKQNSNREKKDSWHSKSTGEMVIWLWWWEFSSGNLFLTCQTWNG